MASIEYKSYANEVIKAIQVAKETALLASALLAKSEAILLAPVAEIAGGNLRQSISYEEDYDNDRIIVGSTSNYSIYVEKGTGVYAEDGTGRKTPWVYFDNKTQQYYYTKGQKPQPFLLPAIAKNKKGIISIFEKELNKLADN